jgi:F-type H+-transporting ATPase subunit b
MDKLGIEPKLLLAQIVNFLIITVILTKLLYKPILTMLEKRKKEIEEGLKLTAKMREDEEKFGQKKLKMLETTRKEAQGIIDEARKQAGEEAREIITDAHKDAEEIIQKGKEDARVARVEMEKNVRKDAVDLAVAMSKRLLAKVLSSDDQHRLIAKNIKELESVKAQ